MYYKVLYKFANGVQFKLLGNKKLMSLSFTNMTLRFSSESCIIYPLTQIKKEESHKNFLQITSLKLIPSIMFQTWSEN